MPQPDKQPDLSATDSAKMTPTCSDQPHLGESELDGMLSSEFLSEMESHLGDAMKVISDENPELWQQLNTFTKSMGLEELGAGPVAPSSSSGETTKGESSVDANSEATRGTRMEGEGDTRSNSGNLDRMLDETLRNLQENTSQVRYIECYCQCCGSFTCS